MPSPTIPLLAKASEPPPFARIGIVGLGLIGGSIALAARQIWPSSLVVAVDYKDVLETAMRLHAIDVAADDLIVLAEVDLVVLAAPVSENIRRLGELDDAIPQAAIVTDVGSTKRTTMAAARALARRFTFVGGHPLAGAAVGGLENARPDLFRGRPWLLTPRDDGSVEAVEKLTRFVSAFGATPRLIDSAAHDRLMAFLSHLPQLTASALMQVIGDAVEAEGLMLAGRGLVDTTRLASSPTGIWRDIAASNASEIGPALDGLIDTLQRLRNDLDTGDALDQIFTSARGWRSVLKP